MIAILPFSDAYGATDDGIIWSRKNSRWAYRDWRPIKPSVIPKGYLSVGLHLEGRGLRLYVHRIVLTMFGGQAPTPRHHAAHRDGNPANNHISNLSWLTASENEVDKDLHGTKLVGAKHNLAKVDEEQVREIRRLLSSGSDRKTVAEMFGLSVEYVGQIKCRHRWRHVA